VPCSELCGCFEPVSRLCSHRRAQRLQPDGARWERAGLQGTQPGLAGCTDAWRLQVRRQLRSLGGPAHQRRRSTSTGAVSTRRVVAPERARREGGPAHRERRSGSSTRWVAAGACTATRARGASLVLCRRWPPARPASSLRTCERTCSSASRVRTALLQLTSVALFARARNSSAEPGSPHSAALFCLEQ